MNKSSNKSAGFDLVGRRSVLSGFISNDPSASVPSDNQQTDKVRWVPIDRIKAWDKQPRKFFSDEGIEKLAQSFKDKGFEGIINVRDIGNGYYEIVAGERRWRAAKLANLPEVCCMINEFTDQAALEFGLVENLVREDLSKLEETEGILQLIETKLGINRDQAIHIIKTEGHSDTRSRSDVAPSDELQAIESLLSQFGIELQTFRTKNLRTLDLPNDLKLAHMEQGLSYSAALEINKVKDDKKRANLLQEVIKKNLSVREIKDRVKQLNSPKQTEDDNLRTRVNESWNKLKRLKLIDNPTPVHQKKIEKLLALIDELVSIEEA